MPPARPLKGSEASSAVLATLDAIAVVMIMAVHSRSMSL